MCVLQNIFFLINIYFLKSLFFSFSAQKAQSKQQGNAVPVLPKGLSDEENLDKKKTKKRKNLPPSLQRRAEILNEDVQRKEFGIKSFLKLKTQMKGVRTLPRQTNLPMRGNKLSSFPSNLLSAAASIEKKKKGAGPRTGGTEQRRARGRKLTRVT